MNFEKEFIKQSNRAIQNSFERIMHCLNQLKEEYVWYRPNGGVNSIGIIINHLCGSIRQWFISGIGGLKDIRNRPLEFDDRKKLSKQELTDKFQKIIAGCKKTINNLDPADLLEKRRIQGFDENVLSAIYISIAHLELHAGQITYITRLILKLKYKLRWIPQTKEQGAE